MIITIATHENGWLRLVYTVRYNKKYQRIGSDNLGQHKNFL